MTVIWGTNYALVKTAFREIDPQAFNALRLIEASAVMVGVNLLVRRFRPAVADTAGGEIASILHTPAPVTFPDWLRLAWLGLVGHCAYQYLFIGGLARTSVANGALIVASSPIVITLLSTVMGKERIGALHWVGTVLSFLGIYIVVGRGVDLGHGLTGDLMMVAAVLCWALYTLGSRRLIARHSPVGVTGLSMTIGTLVYAPVMWGHVRAVPWSTISPRTWIAIVYSSIFALGVAYTIWYAAVRQIGSARTSVYSNVIPLVAMATAVIFLGEPLTTTNVIGAVAVLVGVGLTRT